VRWAAVVAAGALAVAAPAAQAGVVARESLPRGAPVLAVAPVLAGPRVVWGEQSSRRTVVREAGGRPRSFVAGARSADGTIATIEALSATPTRLVIGRALHAVEDPSVVVRTLDGGGLGGPFRSLVGPRFYYSGQGCTDGAVGGAPSFSTSGSMLAWVEVRCDQSADPVQIKLEDRPGAQPRTVATGDVGALGPVRLAGRVIAYRALAPGGNGAPAIVVRDAVTDEELYIADPGPALIGGGTLTDFAVQADGRVVATVSSGAGQPPRLLVFAKDAPQPRELALGAPPGTTYTSPVVVDGRVAVDVRSKDRIRQLVVAGLDGHVVTRVSARGADPLSAGESGGPALDFDGRRLAYATERPAHGRKPGTLRILVQSV
jgi:hypothetical protein